MEQHAMSIEQDTDTMRLPLIKAVETIVKIADPDRIILFGSRARGDSGEESDFDLLVLKKGIRETRRLAQEIHLGFSGIGASIDVIVADLETYEMLKDDPWMIYREAAQHGVAVHGKP
jgi:predicted nucleotidyltransferase